jgi:DUF2075 family protein
MIVYQSDKARFLMDVEDDEIDVKINRYFQQRLGHRTSESEQRSWRNSMEFMYRVLNDPEIPGDCGVAIEYQLPQASMRVDFILSGLGEDHSERMVLIELKQWATASLSEKDAVVVTWIGKGLHELTHPSYQAWSYATMLENFNETVERVPVHLQPCAYLHNYALDDVIRNDHYARHLRRAPVFLKGEVRQLRAFIKQHVHYGDTRNIIYRIEHGRIRPSKMLADALSSMLRGKEEFVMIDEQKVAYESALALAEDLSPEKNVLIVKGGPGTGKSVVAVNLLAELTRRGKNTFYVSKNAAPRAVYEKMLTGTFRKTMISNLFKSSGSFCESPENQLDVLVVDEAHRLNAKSGLFNHLGENQVKELIHAAKTTVFFIDEDQRVTLKDIGTVEEIRKWAGLQGASVEELVLPSQFRCSGSDGYLAWVDHVLQIRETANVSIDEVGYDFQLFSSPVELQRAIAQKNTKTSKARLVAGYCWEWKSKKDPGAWDIELPEFDFQMKWNMESKAGPWLLRPDSLDEIGCIHTCQGLEVDYVGVIIGPDLVSEGNRLITDASRRAHSDKSVWGYQKLLREEPEQGKKLLERIIKNTYRTLMTRGIRGCYVYCTDKELEHYFKAYTGQRQI